MMQSPHEHILMPQGHEIALPNTAIQTVNNRTGACFGLLCKATMTQMCAARTCAMCAFGMQEDSHPLWKHLSALTESKFTLEWHEFSKQDNYGPVILGMVHLQSLLIPTKLWTLKVLLPEKQRKKKWNKNFYQTSQWRLLTSLPFNNERHLAHPAHLLPACFWYKYT